MKKIVLFLPIIILMLLLVSCSHSHKAAEGYKSDDTYHWNSCTNLKCAELINKAEHTWGKGEITTKPTPAQDGVMSYLCTVCGKLKQEPLKYVPISTITKSQWEEAFLEQNFSNVTVKIEESILKIDFKTTIDLQVKEGIVYMEVKNLQDGKEVSYSAKYQEGGVEYTVSSRDQKWEEVRPTLIVSGGVSVFGILKNYGLVLTNCFESFIYNESTGCYEAKNLAVDGVPYGYESVSIKLSDGKIAEIDAYSTDGMHTNVKLSSYGKTTPQNLLEKAE